MSQQISPISAAQHYATGMAFWEDQAKALRHQLDTAVADVSHLRRLLCHGTAEELAEVRATLLEAEKPAAT